MVLTLLRSDSSLRRLLRRAWIERSRDAALLYARYFSFYLL
jgi:hypothetical protein